MSEPERIKGGDGAKVNRPLFVWNREEKMAGKTIDFTTGHPARQLLLFSWPLILAMVLQNFYNMADTLVVGRFVGDTAMGAVGTAGTVTNVMLMLVSGATQGTSVVISQFVGAKDELNVKKTLMTATYIIVALALVFGFLGMTMSTTILRWINVQGEALELAAIYLRIIFAGTVATALYNMGYIISRSLGDSVTPMIVLIVTSILNVGLNVLFVAGFDMGVAGVAYATVIATVISAVVCWTILWKKVPIIRPSRETIRPDGEIAGVIVRIGIPSALMSSTNMIGILVVQTLVNGFTTATLPVMAAYAAATKIEAMISYPPGGLSQGMQILAGQNAGAGKFDRIGHGLAAAIRIIAGYSVFCAAILILFGKGLMGFFTSTPVTVDIGYAYLFITGIGVFFCGVVFTVRYTLNGAGDASASAILSVVELVVRVICAYGFSHFTSLGYIGIFLGTPCGWLVASAVGVTRYKSGKWKQKRIVKE